LLLFFPVKHIAFHSEMCCINKAWFDLMIWFGLGKQQSIHHFIMRQQSDSVTCQVINLSSMSLGIILGFHLVMHWWFDFRGS
jgi:hypothetical protein